MREAVWRFILVAASAMQACRGVNSASFTVSLSPASGPSTCHGILVAARHVLTAAHCVAQPLARAEIDTEQRGIVRSISHPQYDPTTRANDLAIVELDTSSRQPLAPLRWSEVELKSSVGDSTAAWVANGSSDALQSVLVMADCTRSFPWADSSILCARSSAIGATCSNNAGTPLIVENKVAAIACQGNGADAICGVDSGRPLIVGGQVVGIAGVGCTSITAAGNGAKSMFASIAKGRTFIEPYLTPEANANPTPTPKPTTDDIVYLIPSRPPMFQQVGLLRKERLHSHPSQH